MPKLGLIGYPLTHSFSPNYFKNKFEKEELNDWKYQAFPIEDISLFEKIFQEHDDLIGLNVTIPYKEKIIPFLDDLDISAKKIKAVNTIKKIGNQLVGFNTDIDGFKLSLIQFLKTPIQNALILGTGGASKAVSFVLEDLNINYQLVSRRKSKHKISYKMLDREIIESHSLIINTTPLGTYPKIETYPEIPYSFLNSKHYLFDLVYNPTKTVFLKQGEKQGASIKNGLEMLHLQAEKSWEIWNKK